MSFSETSDRRSRFFFRGLAIACVATLAFLTAGFFWATSTPGASYDGPPAAPQDAELPVRLETHIRQLASGPRSLDDVTTIFSSVTYITDALRKLGYEVERQEVIAPADNLVVKIPANSPDAPILILGAHYDTVGVSPGADDNASGVAALLELAGMFEDLASSSPVEIHLIFYANEEPPYFKTGAMGSFVHALSVDQTNRVIGMISLESMGYFSDEPGSQDYPFPLSLRYPTKGNFIAFVGDTSSRDFLRRAIGEFRKDARIPSVGGTAPSVIRGIDWSDHWGYSQVGIPAFMVTDTAPFRNPNYHRMSDTPDTLDYQRLALVVEGLDTMVRSLIFEGAVQ